MCRKLILRIQDTIECNTVDAFQGREKDIIIFNCVRSNDIESSTGALGFLTDLRRLNVAITRPKHFLLVVGNAKTLCRNEVWNNLIDHCKAKGCFVEVSDPHNAKNNLKRVGEFEDQARGSKRQKL